MEPAPIQGRGRLLTSTVYYDIIHPAQNEVAEGDPHSELKNFIGRRNTMTIWAWFLAGLIGLLVYINLGHLLFYVYQKAIWAWNTDKEFNLVAKFILPSPTIFGISRSGLTETLLNDEDHRSTSCDFARFYKAYDPIMRVVIVGIWPLVLGTFWCCAAADWTWWLLYKVLVSGHWTEKLR